MQALGNMLFLQVAFDPLSNDYVLVCRFLITTNNTKNLKHINRNGLMSTLKLYGGWGGRDRKQTPFTRRSRSQRPMHNLSLKLLHTEREVNCSREGFKTKVWRFLIVLLMTKGVKSFKGLQRRMKRQRKNFSTQLSP